MIKFVLIFIVITAIFSLSILSQEKVSTNQKLQETEDQSIEINISSNKTIDLSNQGLTNIPSYIFNQKDTEKIDISKNLLTGAIPAEIRHLSNLKVLDASNNNMTGVPAEIGQLYQLEILDLSNNQLTGLPYELGNLKNLKILNLSGNQYSVQDLEIIQKNLPAKTQIIINKN